MPGNLILPFAFFILALALGGWMILRRFWRLNIGNDEIERAEGRGLVSPSVRKAWTRQRIEFITGIVVTLILTALMIYGVDQMLKY